MDGLDGIQDLWALAINSPMVDIRIQGRQKCSQKAWEGSLAKVAHMWKKYESKVSNMAYQAATGVKLWGKMIADKFGKVNAVSVSDRILGLLPELLPDGIQSHRMCEWE